MTPGSYSLAEALFDRGDAGFVAELRRVHYADRLAGLAIRWASDQRPFARQAILDYLAQPLNCYRHEPLVKRLFKAVEAKGDDELMGTFLAAFDRTIRRQRRMMNRFRHVNFPTRAAAEAAVREWEADGYGDSSIVSHRPGSFTAYATKQEPVVVAPKGTTMPRPRESQWRRNEEFISDSQEAAFARRYQLFSLPTRRYLRRRAWRYFRQIAREDPARYVRAATAFLTRYTDADVDSDIHLLDNWGLMHALFGDSPALVRPAKGWEFAPGKSFADLAPAPRFEAAWAADPQAVFDVMLKANCRPVRVWAVRMIERHHRAWLAARPVATLLALADHADPELSALGFALLADVPDLSAVSLDEWLKRLDGDDVDRLRRLTDLLVRRLDPARVPTADAIRLAGHRSKPVAEFGFAVVQQKALTAAEVPALLGLAQSECEAIRPALVLWLRRTLEGFGPVPASWVLEFLDSKHPDVRAAGWAWLTDSPLRDDPAIWHRLTESPYDDVRERLTAEFDRRLAGADPDAVRLLWATVLTNVTRGGRQKPGVVAQIVRRAAADPGEADRLLPLLAVAVRSLRGPEFRAGLAGIVALAETKPELIPQIRERFPELEW